MTHVIVLGNEKGGSGKSTTAMHLFTALAHAGKTVGAMDLDLRQQSFFRYLDNRSDYIARKSIDLAMPEQRRLEPSAHDSITAAQAEEQARFDAAMDDLRQRCDFVLIDCPGADSHYSRMAHAVADTLITPMNDSLIDFDMLARVDPASGTVRGPSIYSEMVWKARQARVKTGAEPMDWVVLRNRLATVRAHNRRKVGAALKNLSKRIGFRLVPGFSERVIFREMFLSGLTLIDLNHTDRASLTMSNIAARQEMRELVNALNLPGVKAGF